MVIARAAHAVGFPARFQLVAAANPCPCGHAMSPDGRCQCTTAEIERYRARLSGPLADRIDLHVHVGTVDVATLGRGHGEEPSTRVRERVIRARERQRARWAAHGAARANADVTGRTLLAHGGVTAEARAMLEQAATRLGLSARGYHRALKVARTIADLDGADTVGVAAVGEALAFRPTASRGS